MTSFILTNIVIALLCYYVSFLTARRRMHFISMGFLLTATIATGVVIIIAISLLNDKFS